MSLGLEVEGVEVEVRTCCRIPVSQMEGTAASV